MVDGVVEIPQVATVAVIGAPTPNPPESEMDALLLGRTRVSVEMLQIGSIIF